MKDVTPSGITWRNDGTGLGDDAHGNVLHDCVHRVQGAKKDKNAPRKPVIMKDSASSTSIAKIQYGFSEGTIWGLVDGAKSVILDGTPLEAIDGAKNFKNVTYDIRLGTNDQTYMKGFPDVSNEVGIGVELKSSAPYVRAINDTQLSAVRVRLRWNGLSSTNSENGDVSGYRIDYAIDLQTDGGAYVEVLNTSISDKVSTGYERTHRIELPRATGGWQIRIRRLTDNSASEFIRDTMFVDAIAEVIDAKFNYPNTAHMGIEFDSEIFRGIPKLEAHVRGLIIRVPTNYDPVTRTYTGIWDGLFKEAYTNNPAWIYYDIITAKRYGLGDRINSSMVDKWTVYALGVYCDQLVSDGLGGQEPRFTCNVYLQKTSDAYQVLSSLSGVFRAMAFWNGERIVLDADMPKDPVYTFSRANVIADENGICFNHTGSRFRDRHTVVKVAWDNPANAFQTEYEYVRDEKAISKYGIRVLDLSAFACTSQGQAQRAGLWALKTEQLETRQITFSVGLDGFLPQVADVVNVADELFAGRANSGRVSAISAGQLVVTLDRDIAVKAGDILIVNGSDGKAERRVVKSSAGRKVTMVAAFTKAEKQNIWALETADLKLMRFRIMSIQENGDSSFNITALQHEPKKFSAIDFGADVIPDNITSITPDVIDAPNKVTITTRHRVVQGQTITTLVIDWSQVKEAVGYDVEWRKDDGNWIKVPRTGNTSVEIEGVYAGRYTAQVRSISAYDVASPSTFSAITEVKGKVGLPPKIVGLTVKGVLFGFDLNWSFGAGSGDAAFTEIQVATAPNVNVKQLGLYAYNTNKLQINGLMGNLSQSFRARLVDKLGFASAWSAWVTGTTSASAAPIMDMIQGQINESSLNQALTSKIEKIGTNSSSISGINTELDKTKADIAAADKVIADNKLEAANAVAEANAEVDKAKADIVEANRVIAANKLEATNAVAAANTTLEAAKADIVEAKRVADLAKTDSAANKTTIASLTTTVGNNKTSVDSSITTLTNKDISLTNFYTALKSEYDANKASVSQDLTALANEDITLSSLLTTLDTDYQGNKTAIRSELTAVSNKTNSTATSLGTLTTTVGNNTTKISQESTARSTADTTLGNRITTLDTDYQGNKTAIRSELTAVSNKTNSTATSLGTLTTKVGGNTTKISQESTARSTADTALGNRITATDAIAKNAQSRVGTAETAISNANTAIAKVRTDLTAEFTIGENLFSIADAVRGYESEGDIKSSTPNHQTMQTLVPIKGNERITQQTWNPNKISTSNSNRIAFFTASKVYISSTPSIPNLNGTTYHTHSVTPPSDARFIRIGTVVGITDIDPTVTIKFEEGTATAWKASSMDSISNSASIRNEEIARAEGDSALGSRITATDAIAKNAQSRVGTAETAISNANSAIAQQKIDVTAAYTLAIDGVEIGGRNFIDDSNFSTNRWRLGTSNPSGSNTLVTGDVIRIEGNSADYKQWQYYSNTGDAITKVTNGTYTFSVEIRLINGTPKAWFGLREQLVGGTGISNNKYVNITKSWVRYSYTFDITIPSDLERWRVMLASSEINIVEFRRPKIEKGNKATDWSPAPEDIEASVTAESTARSTADTALGNRITATDAIAKNAQSRVSTAETAISNANKAIATTKTELTASYTKAINDVETKLNWQVLKTQQDLDSMLTQGNYFIQATNNINAPFTNWTYIVVDAASAERVSQTIWADNNPSQRYVRVMSGTSWKEWEKMATEAEIDAASTKTQANISNLAQTVADNKTASALTSQTLEARINVSNGTNLFSLSALLAGYYGTDGTITSASVDRYDPNYYPCSGGDKYTFTLFASYGRTGATGRIIFYNSRKNVISYAETHRRDVFESVTVTAPSDAAFFRNGVIGENIKAKLEKGSKATPWTPSELDNYAGKENLFSIADCISGYESGGGIIQAQPYHQTMQTLVPISGDKDIVAQIWNPNEVNVTSGSNRIAFYTSSKTYISSTYMPKPSGVAYDVKTITPPTNARFVRIGFIVGIDGIDSSIRFKVEEGGATPWSPSPREHMAASAAIEETKVVVAGISAQYTLKLDVGGRVSGFGLASSTTQSDFAVNADRFYIAPPSGSAKGTSPFMVLTSPQTINGTSVPAGTYMRSAFIHNGSIDTLQVKNGAITNAKIGELAVDTAQIANGAIETAKIGNLQVDTLQIKGNAVTSPLSSWFAGKKYLQGWDNGGYWVEHTLDIFTLTVPANIPKVIVTFNAVQIFHSANAGVDGRGAIQLLRDGEVIRDVPLFRSPFVGGIVPNENKLNYPTLISITDNPKAKGSVYKVRFYIHAKNGQLHIEGEGFSFSILGAKK